MFPKASTWGCMLQQQANKQKTMMETLLPIHQGQTLINYGAPYPFGRILDGILKDKWRICKYSRGKLSKTYTADMVKAK